MKVCEKKNTRAKREEEMKNRKKKSRTGNAESRNKRGHGRKNPVGNVSKG